VLLLSGPNLNLLGEREPEIYGTATLAEHVAAARKEAERNGLDLEHVQSNGEADLVEAVQRARGRCAAIIVNAAAMTHYAWSLSDALGTFEGPVVELDELGHPAPPGSTRSRWPADSCAHTSRRISRQRGSANALRAASTARKCKT
jgi:3-dehydroquinate dehydratase-2